jgi:hypothetical protein
MKKRVYGRDKLKGTFVKVGDGPKVYFSAGDLRAKARATLEASRKSREALPLSRSKKKKAEK